MLIGHLSDLHLRDARDVAAFDRQLDRIASRTPDHLAITGDLLDRWDPPLLERALDALDAHGFLDPARLTLLHGNHDLASSGGHPRRPADLWRLAFRFWDPPPLIGARKRAFYSTIAGRAPALAGPAPAIKTTRAGARIAVIDTVPVHWRPIAFSGRTVTVKHAVGCVREAQLEWLAGQRADSPLVLLVHHYPLGVSQFRWTPDARWRRLVEEVLVPMAIPAGQQARFWEACRSAGVDLVLCGHVHRARLEWQGAIAVGLNGQSGADWAGRTIAYYDLSGSSVRTWTEPS